MGPIPQASFCGTNPNWCTRIGFAEPIPGLIRDQSSIPRCEQHYCLLAWHAEPVESTAYTAGLPNNSRLPTSYKPKAASGFPYTYQSTCYHFLLHILQTCVVCFLIAKSPLFKWAEWQCSKMMWATVYLCCSVLTAALTHYFKVSWGATHFKYQVHNTASSSLRNNSSCWGQRDSMLAIILSMPSWYTMITGNSFICSNHLACLWLKHGYVWMLIYG